MTLTNIPHDMNSFNDTQCDCCNIYSLAYKAVAAENLVYTIPLALFIILCFIMLASICAYFLSKSHSAPVTAVRQRIRKRFYRER